MNQNYFNTELDEYGHIDDYANPYASFAISYSEIIETELGNLPCARSYIQAPKGRGREAFDALEYMLQLKADASGNSFVHEACDMYGNDAVRHMCEKAGYKFIGFVNGQRCFRKIFSPKMNYIS